MNYGYDSKTKCLFSWDGDFRYEGKVDVAPPNSFLVPDDEKERKKIELVGCVFLSGCCCTPFTAVIAHNTTDEVFGLMGRFIGRIRTFNSVSLNGIVDIAMPDWLLCLCGSIVNNPSEMAQFCKSFPSYRVYACPLVEELAAFGILVANIRDKERPRRTSLCVPNKQEIEGDCLEYDSKLDGDGYGKMADVINRKFAVLNEMMSCPGISPFYGKVLASKSGLPPTYIVRSDSIHKHFPHEFISATHYAATSVPVEVANTPSFLKQSGCNAPKVNIVVSSDHIPGLPIFLNFYRVMSGKDCIGITQPEQLVSSKKVPVFRYNKAYKLELPKHRRM